MLMWIDKVQAAWRYSCSVTGLYVSSELIRKYLRPRWLELDVWYFSGSQFHVDIDLTEINPHLGVEVLELVLGYSWTLLVIK